MATTTSELVPTYPDVTMLAVGSFLACYRKPALTDVLRVRRGELAMYARHPVTRGYAAAAVARRFGTVAAFLHVRRHRRPQPSQPRGGHDPPKVAWEGQRRTVLHPLEFAALPAAARASGPNAPALVACSGWSGCGCRRPAPPTAPTCATRPATSCCT